MPVVCCPSCKSRLTTAFEQLSRTLECPQCQHRFCPLPKRVTADQPGNQDEEAREDMIAIAPLVDEAPHRFSVLPWVIALVGGLTLVAASIFAIALSSERPKGVQASASQDSSEYPYPECEAVVTWLRDNTGHPESVQIIEWGPRELARLPGYANITVKYRAKNAYGAMAVSRLMVHVSHGKADSALDLDRADEEYRKLWENPTGH